MRRAKIVCTIGPATASADKILELVEAGMDVARLNMSHGEQAVHAQAVINIRAASEQTGRSVGILVDLQGPKIRLGNFSDGSALLREGETFCITTDEVLGNKEMASTTYKGLAGDVRPGDSILIDDGRVLLRAESVEGSMVRTTVIEGGRISDHKGINLPGVPVSVPAMSEKDEDDLRWALAAGVDWIALSFVRSAEDFYSVQKIMDEVGVHLPVIAKIEKPQAVDALVEIVERFDAIMVARGDLGVELPLELVPLVQKRAILLAREAAKPVIVATQMLESMVSMSRPTRAEASDVANAVLDGTDALMLSGETSIGSHPIEAVETMARIIEAIEEQTLAELVPVQTQPRDKGEAIASAATSVGAAIGAQALVAFTQTGTSARLVSRYRSPIPIYAFTPEAEVRNRLSLQWGVETFLVPPVVHTDEMVRQVDAALLELGRIEPETPVVIVAGSPPGIPGSTNAMRVHIMGHAVSEMAPAYRVSN